MAEKMKTPVVIGMQRSASRLTWQIVKALEKTTVRPVNWTIPEWQNNPDLDLIWPVRSHEYVSGPPAIFTFRHPIEAFLSLSSKIKIDNATGLSDPEGVSGAMITIGQAWQIYKKIKSDQLTDRPVLLLRYEDYYNEPENRIRDIASFMELEIDDGEVKKIMDDTSIKKNFARGKAMSRHYPEEPFSSVSGAESGMQREHVSQQTFGVPGRWLKLQPAFVNEVRNGSQPALQALKEMCEDMGYEV